MAHIHTEPGQHDHTVSAYLILLDDKVPKILLHLHKKYGRLMQFGGHIELDEDPWRAIIHELEEETGYEINQLKLLQPKTRIKKLSSCNLHPYPVCHNTHLAGDSHFHTDIAYGFTTDQKPKYQISEGESAKVKSFNRQELVAIPKPKTYESAKEISLFIIDVLLKEWEQVPASSI